MNETPLIYALLHTAHALEERLDAAMTAVGLSGARFGVLNDLAEADAPLSLGEIATKQSCVRSNMTQLIDRLEAEELVRRVADPTDRRSVRAEITEAGRAKVEAGRLALAGVFSTFDDALSKNDRVALRRILGALDAPPPHDS